MNQRYFFPIYLLLAMISFSPFRELVARPSVGEIVLALVMPMIALKTLVLPGHQLARFPMLAMVILAWMWLSAGLQDYQPTMASFKMPLAFVSYLALYLWSYGWLQHWGPQASKWLERTILLTAIIFVSVCILQMVLGPDLSAVLMPWGPEWTTAYTGWGFRTYGLLDNPLLVGTYLTICLPFALERLLEGRRTALAFAGLIYVGILMTGSRSCMLATLLVTVFQVGPRLKPSAMILSLAPLAAVVALVLMSPFGARFIDLVRTGGDENVANRAWATQSALVMIYENPLFGVGPGQFANAYAAHFKPVLSQDDRTAFTPDNLLLQLAAECGLPVAGLCLLAYVFMLTTAISNSRNGQRAAVFALLAYGLLSLGVALYATPIMWLMIVLFAHIESQRTDRLSGQVQQQTPMQSIEHQQLAIPKIEV